MSSFLPADILLPRDVDMEKWAVIACDQFTSEPDYWQRVERFVGPAPSTLRLIFPEAELKKDPEAHIRAIRAAMAAYWEENRFIAYPDSFVYVERELAWSASRPG